MIACQDLMFQASARGAELRRLTVGEGAHEELFCAVITHDGDLVVLATPPKA
jgi:hypothetical protein